MVEASKKGREIRAAHEYQVICFDNMLLIGDDQRNDKGAADRLGMDFILVSHEEPYFRCNSCPR